MKSIRRLYFYLVAIISIEVVVWGLVGLLRSIVDQTVSGGADALAQALALILVGVPIFLVHWLWAQRAAAREAEEKEATLRAVFLYAILLGTLIPVVQNLLSFIDRSLVQAAGLGVERAFVSFREQTLADNLIAIGMNAIVAAYFWNVLNNEWATLASKENFSDVRRLYRYIWMLYGLLMTVFGAQQILRYIIYIPGDILGEMGREVLLRKPGEEGLSHRGGVERGGAADAGLDLDPLGAGLLGHDDEVARDEDRHVGARARGLRQLAEDGLRLAGKRVALEVVLREEEDAGAPVVLPAPLVGARVAELGQALEEAADARLLEPERPGDLGDAAGGLGGEELEDPERLLDREVGARARRRPDPAAGLRPGPGLGAHATRLYGMKPSPGRQGIRRRAGPGG